MRITKERVTCRDCAMVQEVELVSDCPTEVACAAMMSARCKYCGGSKLLMGGEHADRPSLEEPLDVRVNWWVARGDTGTSSNTIAAAMRGFHWFNADIPYDPEDFSRCYKLLKLLPEWRARIAEVGVFFPWFKPFSDHWDELERMYEDRLVNSDLSEAMYERMKQLESEAIKIRADQDPPQYKR